MKNYEDNSTKVVKKKRRKHKKSLFDKSIKYTEKILLPLAVIFLTFQYFLLTNKLDKAQETISQISYSDYSETTVGRDKSVSDLLQPGTITQAVNEMQSVLNSPSTEETTLSLDDQEVITSSFEQNAEMASSVDYFAKESDKISKYFSAYKPEQVSESAPDKLAGKNFIEAQLTIANIIEKVADKSYAGDREELKEAFWQLYWNDKLAYDNSSFEYLVLKFGKQLNVDATDFSNLRSISNKIQAEIGNKKKNTFWVEDELNNLRIN